MRTSTVLLGMFFGVILTGTLAPPLYVALPQRFVDDWYYISSEAVLIGLCAALGVTTLAGFLAASLASDEAVRAGTGTGLIATLIAGILVALPAAEIEAGGSLLSVPHQQSLTSERLQEIAAETVIDGVWIPVAAALVLLVIGPALGAMGGVIYDLWRGTVSRTTRMIHLSWIPQVGLWATTVAILLSAVWAAHLDRTVLPHLDAPPTWATRNALNAPLLVAAAASAVLLSWGIRDAVLVFREHRRILGLGWGMLTCASPLLGFVAVAAVNTSALVTLGPWLFVAAVLTAGVLAAYEGSRSELAFDPFQRGLGEVIGEALLAGVVVCGVTVFVCGASVIGTYTIAFPYVLGVLSNAPVIEAPPQDLVNAVFHTHWLAALAIFAVAASYGTVSVPVWMLARLTRR